ncbi:hypothetical protein C0993_010865 [Termitomyces sp. T159_Od127]|nr:hypothetical protein C0993_010865 [Termitomyces sp. T159_Od127]
MRAAWPSAPIEEAEWWEDLIALDATVVFDRVMLINRPAAHRQYVDVAFITSVPCPFRAVVLTRLASPRSGQWNKMIAGTMDVAVPGGFWEPLRRTIVTNLLGHLPTPPELMEARDAQEPLPKPLVTYVSRQHANARRLLEEDHEALLDALRDLEEQGLCEFREARMEEMSLREQVELAARSTTTLHMTHHSTMARAFSADLDVPRTSVCGTKAAHSGRACARCCIRDLQNVRLISDTTRLPGEAEAPSEKGN